MSTILFNLIMLWIHVFSAIIFVGGSFFIWIVVYPASFKITDDEKLRTRIVGKIGKQFAIFTNVSIVVLILTGLYNVTWYFGERLTYNLLFNTLGGQILFTKGIIVLVMILLMYSNNIYHGKKIMKMAEDGDMEGLRKLRKTSHFLSYVTLALMLIITVLAVALNIY
ncbi:MAG: DUF2269 domain-containing protein [Thermoplasmataceae archaeon]